MRITTLHRFSLNAAIGIIALSQATLCWAGPLILATAVTSTCEMVKVDLNAVTYSFYGDGLVYEFKNNSSGLVLTFQGQAGNPSPSFGLPPGSYTLVIKTAPVAGLGQSTSP